MIVRLRKDYRYYEILYETEEEAQAVVDYQEQLLLRGVVEGEYQHERDTQTGKPRRDRLT